MSDPFSLLESQLSDPLPSIQIGSSYSKKFIEGEDIPKDPDLSIQTWEVLPLWAKKKLHNLRESRITLSHDISVQREEMRNKINLLRDWKRKAEVKYQQEARQCTVETNNQVLELKERKNLLSLQFKRELEEKNVALQQLMGVLRSKALELKEKLSQIEELSFEFNNVKRLIRETKIAVANLQPDEKLNDGFSSEGAPASPTVEDEDYGFQEWLNEINRPLSSSQPESINSLLTPITCLVSHFSSSGKAVLGAIIALFLMNDFSFLEVLKNVLRDASRMFDIGRALIATFAPKKFKAGMDLLMAWVMKNIFSSPAYHIGSCSLPTEILKAYVLHYGKQYVALTLGPIFLDILNINRSLEIDPILLRSGASLEENVLELKKQANRILVAIASSYDKIPPILKNLVYNMRGEAIKLYPEYVKVMLGDIFICKLFSPVVNNPAQYGAIPESDVKPIHQRTFNILSKVLDAVVMGSKFKEDFMGPLSVVVTSSLLPMQRFFDHILILI
eukprot:TRINITY_DN6318_c0_g1_i1.p1 TRINITY_DN6318_c0_g1~~TRINITY_DN6318_c0_g1_i1.p1  ORF type:complete len:504 (-),score=80.71 TRINITY_DN6318_c0_g1_i1:1284-2795(-)